MFAILLINCALYSKELCILFYFGILAYYMFGHIWYGRIVLQSFLSPIQTAKKFPFEVLLSLSIFFFTALYYNIMGSALKSEYIAVRFMSFARLLQIYCIEIAVIIISLYIFVRMLMHKKKSAFIESSALGAIIVATVVIFIFKMAQYVPSMANKSYYLIISAVVGIIYIFSHLKNKYLIVLISGAFFITFIWRDYIIHRNEDGFSYRELAEFIISEKEGEKINIFMSNHMEYGIWFSRSWLMPYKYYWPDTDIRVFSSQVDKDVDTFNDKYPIYYKKRPDNGDYFLVRKGEYYEQDLKSISLQTSSKIFENDLFEVYLVKW